MMKSELKPLYVEAAARARCKPVSSEEAVWFSQLGFGDIRDLKTAIDRHFEKSSWMPKESELKPLMAAAQHERLQATAKPSEYFQQQVCPKCGDVKGMMRPVGEQFRTWCLPCQSYRKIVPEDTALTEAQWNAVCYGLEAIYREWVRGGMKPWECVDPQFDREVVL